MFILTAYDRRLTTDEVEMSTICVKKPEIVYSKHQSNGNGHANLATYNGNITKTKPAQYTKQNEQAATLI